jgi:site-specific DNA-methyltransferase (adenine-specific)
MNLSSFKCKELKIGQSLLALYNDDCFNILKNIPDNSIPLVVSDPPYAVGFVNNHTSSEDEWDNFSSKEYIDFMTKWFNEIYRVLTPEGTCWFFYGFTRIKEILTAIDNTKFYNHLENHFVYARSKGRGSNGRLKSLREECGMLTKAETFTWNFEEYLRKVIAPYKEKGGEKRGWDFGQDGVTPVRFTGLGNVIPILTSFEEEVAENRRGVVLDIGSGERLPLAGDIYNLQFPIVPSVLNPLEKQVHSAQKSILLLSMVILLSSKENDTVLDCFGGSFSCGIASALCNRNYIGVELELETYNKGIEHINNTPYDKWETYIKNHISTSEQNFKFGSDVRNVMPNGVSKKETKQGFSF